MYQMTDAAFAEPKHDDITSATTLSWRDGCWFDGLYTRLASCRATLSSSQRCFWTATSRRFLHAAQTRPPTCIRRRSSPRWSPLRCSLGQAFARRSFHLIAGERCGDHDVATYLTEVNAMKRAFLHYGAET
jgi:hypothetical protein